MNNLISLVTDYLGQKETDFAILINGQWGSGKTYFWKNSVVRAIETIEFGKDKEGNPIFYEPIYVSLFGVSSLTEMLTKLSLELLPLKSLTQSKAGRVGGFLLKTVLSRAGNFLKVGGIGAEDEKAFFEAITNFKPNKVLCFDDLERIKPEAINDILGYINQFVEHDKLKVILLADESELLKTGNALYPKMKEKLIRFTFQFNPDISEIFAYFLNVYDDAEFAQLVGEHKVMIVTAFHNGKHKNMRTLRFILDVFYKIFKETQTSKSVLKEDLPLILARLLLFTVSYSIEYKKNNNDGLLDAIKDISSMTLSSEDMINQMLSSGSPYDEKKKVKIPAETEFADAFKNNYLRIENYSFFQFFHSIANFIHHGYLDSDDLKNDLISLQEELTKQKASKEQLLMQQFTRMFYLEDKQFRVVLDEVVSYAINGGFAIQSYPSIIAGLLTVERYELLGFKLSPELIAKLKLGMKKSQANSSFQPFFNSFNLDITDDDSRFNELVKYSLELNEELNNNKLEDFAPDLIRTIRENDESGTREILGDEKNRQYPFLQHLAAGDVLSVLISSNNSTKLSFHRGLELRYLQKYIPENLAQEIPFLEELNKLLKKHIAAPAQNEISTIRFKGIQNLTEHLAGFKPA